MRQRAYTSRAAYIYACKSHHVFPRCDRPQHPPVDTRTLKETREKKGASSKGGDPLLEGLQRGKEQVCCSTVNGHMFLLVLDLPVQQLTVHVTANLVLSCSGWRLHNVCDSARGGVCIFFALIMLYHCCFLPST